MNVVVDEIAEVAAPPKLDGKMFAKTSSLNVISRSSSLVGAQNIVAQGKCIIREQVVLRGDLAKVTLGKCCILNKGTIIHPSSKVFQWGVGFLPVTVGDFVVFGAECVVKAASIGSCVRIGAGAIIGERCILKDACEVLPDAVVPPDTVIAPFTCWGGEPAAMVRTLPDSFARAVEWEAEDVFAKLVGQ